MKIETGDVQLRRPEPDDVDDLLAVKNDRVAARQLGGFNEGYSRSDIEQWIADTTARENDVIWVISESEGRCIGHVGLYKIDQRIRSAEFGILIGSAAHRGKGIGKRVTERVLRYAFEELGLNRVQLTVLDTNYRAIRLYESLGFVREGVLRQAQTRDGHHQDLIVMSLLAEERHDSPPRWEHGSDFHWVSFEPLPEKVQSPWAAAGPMFASGRDALVSIQRLLPEGTVFWLPEYYCEEVADALAPAGPVKLYPDFPSGGPPNLLASGFSPGDAVVIVNFFGMRTQLDCSVLRQGVLVIEDHTHDPWSPWAYDSSAHYCFASLRKTLPIPAGTPVWSPQGLTTPSPSGLTQSRSAAILLKTQAMLMKSIYLSGGTVAKESYLDLLRRSEEMIAGGDPSGVGPAIEIMVNSFPVHEWRRRRMNNYQTAVNELRSAEGLSLLQATDSRCVPYSIVLTLDDARRRDMLRDQLNSKGVYSSILWTLRAPPFRGEDSYDLSTRILSLHCDMRYSPADISRVARLLQSELMRVLSQK